LDLKELTLPLEEAVNLLLVTEVKDLELLLLVEVDLPEF